MPLCGQLSCNFFIQIVVPCLNLPNVVGSHVTAKRCCIEATQNSLF